MSQHYSDVTRAESPYSLPDVETFYLTNSEARAMFAELNDGSEDADDAGFTAGWYYWFCLPGCLPDSEAMGPFASEDEALEDARADVIGFCADDDSDAS